MANLLDEASILLTPTAYNNGSMLAVKPTNGDGDFTFSRNSAATRVNAQGLVENVQILSSNLVSNGDFSQEGAEEVSNGSFSQEGAEQVTAFTNGTTYPFSTFTSLDNNITSAIINSNFAGCVSNSISVTSSQTYKVSFNYTKNSGDDLRVVFSSSVSGAGSQTSNSELVSTSGSITLYLTISSSGTSYLQLGTSSGSASIDFSITNISVKEVGQDWDFVSGATVGDDKAIISGDGSVAGLIEQTSVFSSGKTYKITLDAVINSGGGLNVKHGIGYADNIGSMITTGSYTFYYTAPSTKSLVIARKTGGVAYDSTITNISVKEVGQDWTITDSDANNYVEFGDGTARLKFLNTSPLTKLQSTAQYISGKKYKLTVNVKEVVSGGVKIDAAGVQQTYNSVGIQESIIEPTGNSFISFYRATANVDITLNSVSLIEITDDTNLPRINYEGFSYQDSLGSEEIVNGDFATDSDWSKTLGWSIGSGTANCDGSQTGNTYLTSQSENAIIGKTYIISFTTSNITSGWVRARVGGVNTSDLISTNGQYAYTVTATASTDICRVQGSVDFNGSIDNVSVKEYLGQEVVPNSGCGSWLLEPQSTNLITQSEIFTSWSGYQATSNTTTSPSGNSVLFLDFEDRRMYTTTTILNSTEYTSSIYLKANKVADVKLRNAQDLDTIITLTTNWKRYELTATSVVTSTNALLIDARFSEGLGASGLEIALWGAQLEQNSFSTSYIPTQGASSTRLADIATNSGNASLINSEEGVLYAETHNVAKGFASVISLTDGSNNQRVMIYFNSDLTLHFYIRVNSSYEAIFIVPSSEINFEDTNKIAIKYKTNDMSFWLNGTKVGADTTGTMFSPNTLTQLGFNSGSGGAFYGNTKALAVYKTALTDAQLTLLTTI